MEVSKQWKAMTTQTTSVFRPEGCQRGDDLIPNRVQSWIYWRELFLERIPGYEWVNSAFREAGYTFGGTYTEWCSATQIALKDPTHNCSMCYGLGKLDDDNGLRYCMCKLIVMRDEMRMNARTLGIESTYTETSINEYQIWGSEKQKEILAGVRGQVEKWIERPVSWLVLHGPTGSGKTFLLGSIMRVWKSITLYVEASNLEGIIFDGLNDKSLSSRMNAIDRAPILIIDDFGIQYSSPFIQAQVDKIIQYRAKEENYYDCLTVISTNWSAPELVSRLQTGDISRSGSRLVDGRTKLVFVNAPEKKGTEALPLNDYRFKRRDKDKQNG